MVGQHLIYSILKAFWTSQESYRARLQSHNQRIFGYTLQFVVTEKRDIKKKSFAADQLHSQIFNDLFDYVTVKLDTVNY